MQQKCGKFMADWRDSTANATAPLSQPKPKLAPTSITCEPRQTPRSARQCRAGRSGVQQAHKSNNPNTAAALKSITSQFGTHQVSQLTLGQVEIIEATWASHSQHTKKNYAQALRRFLRWCEETQHAPKLSRAVRSIRAPSPRAITAHNRERDRLLTSASPRLRFFLLLCADLGLRHRTATRIALTTTTATPGASTSSPKAESIRSYP